MITDSLYDCPVCRKQHGSGPRLVGLAVLACDQLTPVGETRFFPLAGVIIVGAGEWVTTKPDKPATEADAIAQRNAKLQALEAEKARRDAEHATAARIETLERELAGAPAQPGPSAQGEA